MNRLVYSLLVVVTTALMGSSFAVGKIGLEYASPLLLVGIRFTLAGFMMALAVIGRPHPRRLADWLRMALIGAMQTAGVMGCIFVSMRTITAAESSILTFVNPLIVIVLATAILRSRYSLRQWSGVGIGFIGVFIALGLRLDLRTGTWIGLLGAVFWAIATLLVTVWRRRFDVWVLTAYQMLFGGLLLLASSPLLEKPAFDWTVQAGAIILWLAVMGSIVQFAIWFYLLRHGDPAKTSAFLFLAPFFGVVFGWLLLGEVVQPYVYVGSLMIFAGIFLVNWPARSDRLGA